MSEIKNSQQLMYPVEQSAYLKKEKKQAFLSWMSHAVLFTVFFLITATAFSAHPTSPPLEYTRTVLPNQVPNFVGRINGQVINGQTINSTNPRIDYSWSHASDPSGIERYHIVFQPTRGPWHTTQQVLYPATSYSMQTNNLIDGTSYSIHIRAKSNAGSWGPFIRGGIFTVQLSGPDTTPPSTVPNFVGRINGQIINGQTINSTNPRIDYSWNHASDASGIAAYHIVFQPTGGPWLISRQVAYPATSYSMQTNNLINGASYSIHIRARDNAGNWGPFVNGGFFTVDVLPPDTTPPSTVPNFVGRIDGQPINGRTITYANPLINYSWNHATDASGIQCYEIVLQPLGGPWLTTKRVNYPATSTSMQTSNLTDGRSYSIHIRAKDNAGNWGRFVNGGVFSIELSGGSAELWSAPATWRPLPVPGPGSNVVIADGKTVILDVNANVSTVTIRGTLKVKRDINVNLSAKRILVEGANAEFDWGTAADPYLMRSVITLTGSNPNDSIPGMGAKFLAARMGGTIQVHGAPLISWSQLGANVNPNRNQITLKEAVNWRVGDQIVIVSSRRDHNQAEKRTITAIGSNRRTVTLNSNLRYPHKGVVKTYSRGSKTWTADLRAQVGLLTHNITIQGDAQSTLNGFGGHIMLHSNAKAYFDGVELYNMGQKAKLGRYPFHWHMLGDIGQGQYFKNSSVHQSYNRAITVHGTESALVENNFFYDHIGHGVFLEDGSERFNIIRRNVTLLTKRPAPGEEVTPSDNQFIRVQNLTPSSYWITNPQNTFEDNVAAGTEGTGYWFAFPTSPMGPSATDPRFRDLKPHTLPLISFKGNSAHSCGNGFDIFDQLAPDHSILPNRGWFNDKLHLMEDCLWYANNLGLYAGLGIGGPTDNLIFRNNVFVENRIGTMFASYCIVDQSAIVANSGENLIFGERYAYRVYDGAGQIHNSHFIGWDADNASFLTPLGAAIKHPNHRMINNSTDHAGTMRCVMPNMDMPPDSAGANDFTHPRRWSIVVRDVTGDISGKANTSIIGNHPFQRVGDEFQPSNWVNTLRSDHHFALSRLTYDIPFEQTPNIVATRTKSGTPTEHVYYIYGYKEWHQLPFIVNEGFEYTYQYEALPSRKIVRMYMEDATIGDDYIVRYKDFGKLGGLGVTSTQGFIPSHSSLNSLRQSNTSGYYRQTNGDLYIKAVATSMNQRFDIRWTTNFLVPEIDTDGDEVSDGVEIRNERHPFDASDLAAEFAQNADFEGWTTFRNISGQAVLNNVLRGTSTGSGDAQVRNNAYNFNSDEVPYISLRIKASRNSIVQLFFATSTTPGFSTSRVISANYTGNGAWQTIPLNTGSHLAWNNLITDLRLDPVAGSGIYFEIDWIRASASRQRSADQVEVSLPDKSVSVYPNPLQDYLQIELGQADLFHSIRLVDLQGRVVRQATLDSAATAFQWSFRDQPLAAGVYMLQLIGLEQTEQVKLVKLN